MSSIERKCDGIKVDIFDENTEGFPVGTSDYESNGLLYRTMIGVTHYSKVWEELGCKEGTVLVVSVWAVEGIHEVTMLGFIEDSLEWISLGIFSWASEGVK